MTEKKDEKEIIGHHVDVFICKNCLDNHCNGEPFFYVEDIKANRPDDDQVKCLICGGWF